MRKKFVFCRAGLLVADVLLIGYLMYDYIQNKIPDSVLTYVGEKQGTGPRRRFLRPSKVFRLCMCKIRVAVFL